jgi:hypothetical protein
MSLSTLAEEDDDYINLLSIRLQAINIRLFYLI